MKDWEKRESDEIYVDVPFERRIISKIIEENTYTKESLAESIGAPLITVFV